MNEKVGSSFPEKSGLVVKTSGWTGLMAFCRVRPRNP